MASSDRSEPSAVDFMERGVATQSDVFMSSASTQPRCVITGWLPLTRRLRPPKVAIVQIGRTPAATGARAGVTTMCPTAFMAVTVAPQSAFTSSATVRYVPVLWSKIRLVEHRHLCSTTPTHPAYAPRSARTSTSILPPRSHVRDSPMVSGFISGSVNFVSTPIAS